MSNGKTVLVTGGAGYIGSHCVVSLQEAGYDVVALDNFTNSVIDTDNQSMALKRAEKITQKPITFYKCDLLNKDDIDDIFVKHKINSVIHLAAMKAVGESMQFPMMYYKNNLIGMINLLEVMEKYNCYTLVFSSSCTVYGEPESLPITEEKETGRRVTNVYGKTKYFIEEMLKDVSHSNEKWNIIALRYFNPVGAHQSGLIGEDPTKQFTNLMPFISQVASGKKPSLTIFGNDYETPDGTGNQFQVIDKLTNFLRGENVQGIRDYIHVMDLATGHVAALAKLEKQHLNVKMYNLGTGKGVSVMELITTFEQINNVKVPYQVEPRRAGDISEMYADPSLAEKELNWKATRSIQEMCSDFWKWQQMNPDGYKSIITNGHK